MSSETYHHGHLCIIQKTNPGWSRGLNHFRSLTFILAFAKRLQKPNFKPESTGSQNSTYYEKTKTLIHPLLFKWDGTTLGDEVSTDETSLQTNTLLSSRITPNPFFTSIRIDLSAFRHGRYVLRDISGQAIRQASFYGQEFEINGLDRLSPGVYVLELKGKDFFVSRKVFKR